MTTGRDAPAASAPGNSKLYVTGGWDGVATILGSVEEYNPTTNLWANKASMQLARREHVSASTGNGKLYVVAGSNDATYFTNTEEYDATSNTWTSRANCNVERRGAGAASTNNHIYLIGGYNNSNTEITTNEEYTLPLDLYWFTKN
jgi:hypothetical protein